MTEREEWANRLATQYGSLQVARLRGDAVAERTAVFWLNEIASDHWHEIIAALGTQPSQPQPDFYRGVVERCARIMRGEGVEDQGQAWDLCLRTLDDALARPSQPPDRDSAVRESYGNVTQGG